MPKVKKKCQRKGCGATFEVYPSRLKAGGGKYCSRECAHPLKGENRICPECGDEFYAKLTRIKRGLDIYCGNDCANKNRGSFGEDNGNWNGGSYICESGYRWILCDDGTYEMEHRLKMSQKIGRRLEPDEHVHHKNEDKLDNRLSNLILLNPTEHAIHHNKKRARERRAKRR